MCWCPNSTAEDSAALAAGPRGRDLLGIFVQDAPHAFDVAKSSRDYQVVGRPALDEQSGGRDVTADTPERAVPERQVDRLEAGGGIAAVGAGTGTVLGMDVRAAIQQQLDHLARRRGHRPVQWRARRAVDAVNQLRVGVEKLAHPLKIAGGRREVDRVIGCGRGHTAAVAAGSFKQQGDCFVSTIAGHDDQVVPEPHRGRVRARIEQKPYRLEVPFPHREVDRLSVPVLRTVQVGIVLQQAPERVHVAGSRGADRIPHVAAAARPWPVGKFRCEFGRSDHSRHLVQEVELGKRNSLADARYFLPFLSQTAKRRKAASALASTAHRGPYRTVYRRVTLNLHLLSACLAVGA